MINNFANLRIMIVKKIKVRLLKQAFLVLTLPPKKCHGQKRVVAVQEEMVTQAHKHTQLHLAEIHIGSLKAV